MGVLIKRGNLDTDTYTHREPYEHTGRRQSPTSQGDKPQNKPTLPTP